MVDRRGASRSGRRGAARLAGAAALGMTALGMAALGTVAGAARAQPAAGPGGAVPRPAPEFTGIKGWLNGGPLTMAGLRGKVVLVDFWAYSCINCIRTLPFLEKWQGEYGPRGLQVIGVHTPEFRFETNPANIESAIRRFNIDYPVAEDSDDATWNAYGNQFWPEEYLIDRSGRIVRVHAGEGEYGATENAIRRLLGVDGTVGAENGADLSRIGSPEMYLGLDRVQNLASPEGAAAGTRSYTAPGSLPLNRFALEGRWTLTAQRATSAAPGGRILLHARSGKIFMVASAAQPVTVAVTVDGRKQPAVTVRESRLYTLLDGADYGDHEVELDAAQAGLSAFTFTFG